MIEIQIRVNSFINGDTQTAEFFYICVQDIKIDPINRTRLMVE